MSVYGTTAPATLPTSDVTPDFAKGHVPWARSRPIAARAFTVAVAVEVTRVAAHNTHSGYGSGERTRGRVAMPSRRWLIRHIFADSSREQPEVIEERHVANTRLQRK